MKQYECFWGDGYREDDNKSILVYHLEDFFNHFQGYDDENVYKIHNMEVNDKVYLSEMGEEHWVRRIK
jgi:hypothetical protein